MVAFLLTASAAVAQDMSSKAREVLEYYRTSCEQPIYDLQNETDEAHFPTFAYGEQAYRQVFLNVEGIAAELLYTGDMTCDGRSLGYCGSGGCSGHIIFKDYDYAIMGSRPFLLHPEAGADDDVPAFIAWGAGRGPCKSQKQQATEKLLGCLMVAYYDDYIDRLVFPLGYLGLPDEFPIGER